MTVSMSVQSQIRVLDAQGVPGRQIARTLGVSRDSVAKYAGVQDCSPKPPTVIRHPKASVVAPFSEVIQAWLVEDWGHPRKQRHTAKRVFDRLVSEYGYEGSYSAVQKWVKHWREGHREEGDGFAELVWSPGCAQVDFGQAQAFIAGIEQTLHMLVVTFPHSNARFAQGFLGETSECVCEGLLRVFTHIGGAARILVLDNATDAGRRRGTKITESHLFAHFKEHYRTQARYCNPYSGNEKGSVENAVGFLRRNLMVPIPRAPSLCQLNEDLLTRCDALLDADHYRVGCPVANLFTQDQQALLALPGVAFDAVTYQQHHADKDGRIQINDTYYLVGPAYHSRTLTVGLRAETVTFLDEANTPVRVLPRAYGPHPTTVFDPSSLITHLIRKPASFGESLLRTRMPATVVDFLDNADTAQRRRFLRALDTPIRDIGYTPTLAAADQILTEGRTLETASLTMLARRLTQPHHTPTPGVDLSVYDQLTPPPQH